MNSPQILELFNQRNLRLATNALFCGMGIHLPVALEGALKLKVRLEIREVAGQHKAMSYQPMSFGLFQLIFEGDALR